MSQRILNLAMLPVLVALASAGCSLRRDLAPGVALTTAGPLTIGHKWTVKTDAVPASGGDTITFSWRGTPAARYRVRVMWHEDGAKEHRGPYRSITLGDLGNGCLQSMELRDQTGALLLVPEEGPPYGADRSSPPRAELSPEMDLTLTIRIDPQCPTEEFKVWALLQSGG